jgi:hypothetical protein
LLILIVVGLLLEEVMLLMVTRSLRVDRQQQLSNKEYRNQPTESHFMSLRPNYLHNSNKGLSPAGN